MPTENDLKGLRVAVTGGTSGLGLALVRRLASQGARIAFVARTKMAVIRTAEETGAHGIVGDVGRKHDIYPIALQITGNLGGLDVLINNASSLGPTPLALLADTQCEALEQALAVNLVGPFRLTKALFGALAASAREGHGALVINISSDASDQRLFQLGRLWREQGGAPPPHGDLDRGGKSASRALPFGRSRRHGYAAARPGDPRCRPVDVKAPRGFRSGNRRYDVCRIAEPSHDSRRGARMIVSDRPDR